MAGTIACPQRLLDPDMTPRSGTSGAMTLKWLSETRHDFERAQPLMMVASYQAS